MICLRCGQCCKYFSVMIVDNPELGIVEDNIIHHKGDGSPCKHLIGNKPGEYKCAVHDLPWYKDTPCFSHGQVEHSPFDLCRLGVFILKNLKGKEENVESENQKSPS